VRLLAVGTVVTVTPQAVKYLDDTVRPQGMPFQAVVLGYDMGHTKYMVGREIWPGKFARTGEWFFPKEVKET